MFALSLQSSLAGGDGETDLYTVVPLDLDIRDVRAVSKDRSRILKTSDFNWQAIDLKDSERTDLHSGFIGKYAFDSSAFVYVDRPRGLNVWVVVDKEMDDEYVINMTAELDYLKHLMRNKPMLVPKIGHMEIHGRFLAVTIDRVGQPQDLDNGEYFPSTISVYDINRGLHHRYHPSSDMEAPPATDRVFKEAIDADVENLAIHDNWLAYIGREVYEAEDGEAEDDDPYRYLVVHDFVGGTRRYLQQGFAYAVERIFMDSTFVATIGDDEKLRVWDYRTGRLNNEVELPRGVKSDMHIEGGHVLISYPLRVIFLDIDSGKLYEIPVFLNKFYRKVDARWIADHIDWPVVRKWVEDSCTMGINTEILRAVALLLDDGLFSVKDCKDISQWWSRYTSKFVKGASSVPPAREGGGGGRDNAPDGPAGNTRRRGYRLEPGLGGGNGGFF